MRPNSKMMLIVNDATITIEQKQGTTKDENIEMFNIWGPFFFCC